MLSTRTVTRAPAPRSAGRATPFSIARRCSQRSGVVARVANITPDNFEDEVIKASTSQPVLVDFWASWCGPCKLVAPLMEWADKEYGEKLKVVKVEHDKNPELIAKYKVYGLPTLIVFKDGDELAGSKREGAVTKPLLEAYLKKQGISK